ncbi:MAG: FG-GAP repeat domain-containing protein [Candidatus Eiseniibacteriota bacterium]
MKPIGFLTLAAMTCTPVIVSASGIYHVGVAPPLVGLAAMDVVGDGRLDLMTVARSDLSIRILRGDPVVGFADALLIPSENDARRAASGDVNGDGIPDLLDVGHDNSLNVRLGLGSDRFGPVARYSLRNHANYLAVVDLNHDAFADVVVAHDGSGNPVYVTAFLGSSSGDLQPTSEQGTSYGASMGIAAGDFDGDGNTDVAVALSDVRASALVFHGLGNGEFSAPIVIPTVSADPGVSDGTVAITAGDLDRDGRDDLVLACFGITHQLVVRLGTASGFADPVQIPLPSPVSVALGDVNGDGRLDVVACNLEQGSLSLLYGRGDGTLEPPVSMPTSPNPDALIVADLDLDGRADIAVTDLSDDAIRVYSSVPTDSVPTERKPTSLGFTIAGSQPFHDQARLRFSLPDAGRVRLAFFDTAGRRVPGGMDETLPAGAHEVTWNARGLAPGIYMARIAEGARSRTLRLVFIR